MSNFLTLLKINFNLELGISALKYRFTKEKKRLWEPFLILFAVIIGGGSLLFLYSILLMFIFAVGQALGHPEIVLTVSFMASQLVILLFGIFYIISAFYFSNDMAILIPLPIKPGEVLGVKFITVLLGEYIITLPLLLPAFIIYGAGSFQGLFYWLKGFILILTTPVLPLVVAAILVVILMRLVNIQKTRDLMVVIGGLLGLFLGIGINFFAQSIPQGSEGELLKNFIESNTALIEAIGNRFPPSIWATFSLSRPGLEGFSYFLLSVGLTLILLFLLFWIGNHFFYKGYLSGQETKRKNKSLSQMDIERNTSKVSSPIKAIVFREFKMFFRTPIYVINGLAGMIMIPFLMVMPFITKSQELSSLIDFAKDPKYIPIIVLAALCMSLFASGSNSISATALSREGKTFWMSQVIPIPPASQVMAKLLYSDMVSMGGFGIIVIFLFIFFHIPLIHLFFLVIMGILANSIFNILGIMIDILRPKLAWDNPQEAIKQNLNVFFGMLVSFLVIGIIGTVSVIAYLAGINEFWIYSILILILILLLIPALHGLFSLANARYKRIEL